MFDSVLDLNTILLIFLPVMVHPSSTNMGVILLPIHRSDISLNDEWYVICLCCVF